MYETYGHPDPQAQFAQNGAIGAFEQARDRMIAQQQEIERAREARHAYEIKVRSEREVRATALGLANHLDGSPKVVVERAAAYLEFLKGGDPS